MTIRYVGLAATLALSACVPPQELYDRFLRSGSHFPEPLPELVIAPPDTTPPADITALVDTIRADTPSVPAVDSVLVRSNPSLYVLVDLDRNELRLMSRDRVLWSAPVGTGTGLSLEGEKGQSWEFSTPTGTFFVQLKERNPVWIRPDWYYVKNNLPIPPADSPERYIPGDLGPAAIYFGQELAIHGTDKPELLGQRVSHGCIRLENANALRLFHNVQVGTPVVIIGGNSLKEDTSASAILPSVIPDRGRIPTYLKPHRETPADSLPATDILLMQLSLEKHLFQRSGDWIYTASALIDRSVAGDQAALEGLLRLSTQINYYELEREFSTFLADVYHRSPLHTLPVLGSLEKGTRDHVARLIVRATLDLYSGDLSQPSAPFPSRRLSPTLLDHAGHVGYNALRAAEREYMKLYTDWEPLPLPIP